MEDVTERRKIEAERKTALDHAERLLEELNHRVMNNLAMINSIITVEARLLSDDQARGALERLRDRVGSVAALYRNLSNARAFDTVDAGAYLSKLAHEVVASARQASIAIETDFQIAPIQLSTRVAVPLGLIVNEVLTNSLKYAFEGRSNGHLGMRFHSKDGGFELIAWDDGAGIEKKARTDSGIGSMLTAVFSEQLSGTTSLESGESGTRFSLRFPAE